MKILQVSKSLTYSQAQIFAAAKALEGKEDVQFNLAGNVITVPYYEAKAILEIELRSAIREVQRIQERREFLLKHMNIINALLEQHKE